jgi:hypothetical protein
MAFDGDRAIQMLLPDQLEGYRLTGKGDFPRITEGETKDKKQNIRDTCRAAGGRVRTADGIVRAVGGMVCAEMHCPESRGPTHHRTRTGDYRICSTHLCNVFTMVAQAPRRSASCAGLRRTRWR